MYTWDFFVQELVNGLTLGSVYALIALGYSMVYGILKLLNFAHGEVYMIGAFIGYGVLTVSGGPANPMFPIWLLISFMFLAAMIGAGLLGVVVERFAYRPLRNAPRIAPLISALGVSFFLQNSALLLFSADFRSYGTFQLDDGALFVKGIHWGPLNISLIRIIVIVSTAALMVGLVFQRVYHFMGFVAGLKGFTAAVIGGIGSIPGAMLGGLVIGLAEAFSTGYLSSTFYDLIVFGLLIAMLLVRPTGLLGKADIKKV